MICTSSVLAEANPFEQPFELRARHEAGQDIVDLLGAHLIRAVDPFGADPQPEAAEITQLDDIALRKLFRDDAQDDLDRAHQIRSGQRAHLGGGLHQLTGSHAAAGFDGWIELLGFFRLGRVAPFDDLILNYFVTIFSLQNLLPRRTALSI